MTPHNTAQDGAAISIASVFEVATSTNTWDIEGNSQNTWHLIVDLDNTWGFHPNKPSSIYVEIDSPTIALGTNIYVIILGFQVKGGNGWTAIRLNMDDTRHKSLITLSCDDTAPYTNNINTEDLGTYSQQISTPLVDVHYFWVVECGPWQWFVISLISDVTS